MVFYDSFTFLLLSHFRVYLSLLLLLPMLSVPNFHRSPLKLLSCTYFSHLFWTSEAAAAATARMIMLHGEGERWRGRCRTRYSCVGALHNHGGGSFQRSQLTSRLSLTCSDYSALIIQHDLRLSTGMYMCSEHSWRSRSNRFSQIVSRSREHSRRSHSSSHNSTQ